jgi:putative oxidoreductase
MPDENIPSRWRSWAPQFLSILRIVAAFLFIQFGTAKLFAMPGPLMPGGGTVPVGSLVWFAAIIESVGGVLLLFGLCTRPVAFIVSGEMAIAYFHGHAPHGFWPVLNGGHPAVLFCFVWLYFSSAGAGPWSLDALFHRRPAAALADR